ncbi:hypothetical protein HQ584_13150 [Patescibacteria group bacterium]|nr:hypothetical protein [Patescibacteria group bacterium]
MPDIRYAQRLKLFNEKVSEIKKTNFVRWFKRNNLSFTFPILGLKYRGTRKFPTIESARSFILLFRFFIQDNEAISIRNIANVYDAVSLSAQTKSSFYFYRDHLNIFLHSLPGVRVVGERRLGKLNNWEILKIFIYGKLAHQSKAQYKRYKVIENDEHLCGMYWCNFFSALSVCLHYIVGISEVNKNAIRELIKQ